MTKKLSLVRPDAPGTAPEPASNPPRPLGTAGAALWRSINSEFDISDGAGSEMLCQACQALDRAEELSEAIARDGAVVRTKAGPKAHPALKDELAARSFVVRTLHRLGLDSEPIRTTMGRPPLGM